MPDCQNFQILDIILKEFCYSLFSRNVGIYLQDSNMVISPRKPHYKSSLYVLLKNGTFGISEFLIATMKATGCKCFRNKYKYVYIILFLYKVLPSEYIHTRNSWYYYDLINGLYFASKSIQM